MAGAGAAAHQRAKQEQPNAPQKPWKSLIGTDD
jgi:hypothetical protein